MAQAGHDADHVVPRVPTFYLPLTDLVVAAA